MYNPKYLDKMRDYFEKRNAERKGSGRTRDIEIGSPAGLALHLGISANELKSYEGGEKDAAEFYQEYLTRYEMLADQYAASGQMKAAQRSQLDDTLFSNASGDDNTGIHIVYTVFNAPDEYDHFMKMKRKCDDAGISLNKAFQIITDYLEDQT